MASLLSYYVRCGRTVRAPITLQTSHLRVKRLLFYQNLLLFHDLLYYPLIRDVGTARRIACTTARGSCLRPFDYCSQQQTRRAEAEGQSVPTAYDWKQG